jgi:hypothetical protein
VKKIFLLFIFLFVISCNDHYQPNYQINKRTPPVIIIAIDSTTNSVVMRDGDNQIFTIYDKPTTKAITKSLKIRDTLRLPLDNSIRKKF